MKLVELLVWSDSNRFSRRANRDNNMDIEGRRYAGRKNLELWSRKEQRDIAYIKKEIERIELQIRQDKKMVQVCELEIGKFLNEDNEMGSFEDLKHC
jgi:hypothetical protein